MKIGVITHWRSDDNYGQTLQLYALQKVLKQMGHNPFLIRYITNNGSFRWRLKNRVLALYRSFPEIIKKNLLGNSIAPVISRKAQAFISEYVNVSDHIYTRRSILKTPPVADAFITGSDQVWNKLDGSYFLDFCNNSEVKKISYAASFGGNEYSGLDAIYVKRRLEPFKAVSVREEEGIKQCKKLGVKDPQLVPDPTLLLNKNDYSKLIVSDFSKKRYIFVYLLGNKTSFDIADIYDFAKQRGLEVIYVASQGRLDDFEKIYPDIPDWLSLISSAEYIVTNSFHGTVFSLIFERQFITIPLSGSALKMNGRINTLLNQFNLNDRLTTDLKMLAEEIDYLELSPQFDKYRSTGLSFLKYNLDNEL